MGNQLQEVKNQFAKDLFEVIYQEVQLNNNNDLFSYYNLIIANLDKHDDIFKDIFINGLIEITYINEDMGYTDGNIIIYLKDNTRYDIKLIWRENMIGDYYENEECILKHEYKITKKITKIIEMGEVLEEDTDKNLLEQIEKDVEKEIKEIKEMELKMKQNELLNILTEKENLELDIKELEKELNSH
ncbi:hypothetical protein [Clostridium sp. CTA-6]|nr:hypothetical protein [Clostridium botulinum]EKS4395722.1 hypothetical protein [Clostridium botulinum]